ncbi:hypothetical protein HanXRQr2_Chr03g0105661 [Helianthus annuus]|uniref:Uncharacterized protein n=1 Tax=Helianthus annuus TaxID=4232 RepID=A0A9K3JGB1_HELAN|nr:hypothetical protein HanXRQr2_Chr03g0105661 [Helianthus annuus]KAJ0943279.1 hypothetical protein HanPSC8_Chr03g0102261 [Helianthus annuus]
MDRLAYTGTYSVADPGVILLVVKLVGSVNEPKLVRLAHGSNLYVCGLTRRTTKSLLLKLFIWKNHDLFFLFVDYMVWN